MHLISPRKRYFYLQNNISFYDSESYQIVGRNDWNSSLESTLIRKDKDTFHIVEDGMHFNILFHEDMEIKFPEFLEKSSQNKL